MADNAEAEQHAILNYPGGELELDIVKASEGADGIALGSLLAKTGYTTFDGGFVNTRGGIRTPNPRFRRPMLYPIELRAQWRPKVYPKPQTHAGGQARVGRSG